MKKNFNDESIPNIDQLLTDIETSYKNEIDNTMYTFNDMFQENSKGRYKIKKEFKARFRLNSKNGNRNQNNELSGLYIFFDKTNNPIYVGISRTIFRRMRQHFLSDDQNQSSLVYLIAKKEYSQEKSKKQTRKQFLFSRYRKEIQQTMINEWKIQFIPETDNYKIYLKEIYIACYNKTYWNTFVTH